MLTSTVDKKSSSKIMTPDEVAAFCQKSTSWVYDHWEKLGGVKRGNSLIFPSKENLLSVYLTQKELADRYSTSESTIKNWRDRGYLPFFRLPGSTRVLYPLDGILEVEQQYTTPAKEVKHRQQSAEVKRKKPVISATPKKEWRI
jgi:predicted DNA-binding transcriptional regulator AlpA